MLLNKKILIFCALFLLLASLASAEVCEVDRIKQVLKKILFLYYTEPGSVPLTQDEVKDMLVFYLSISDRNITIDCSAFGSRSNRPISDVVNAGDNVADKIPSCPDGTKYGECSKFRPAYCYAGAIYSKCDLCGCPTNSVCGKSQKCEATGQNISCFKDIDCWQVSSTGSYYCINGYIVRDSLNYTCVNPGTTASKCISANSTIWLTYCNPSLNQTCVIGQNYCKVPVTNATTASNQTFSGILTVKGRLIDYFTKQPIANGLIYTWDSQTARRDTYTNSNGEFSTTVDTTQIMITASKPYGLEPKCYDNVGMGVTRDSNNNLYVSVTINSITGASKTLPVTGSEVNFGDITMWPAVDIQIDSDIYVKFGLEYSSSTGSGNSLYKIYHYLSNSFPLTVDTRVKLTDQSGNNYYSPYLNLPLSNGCQKVGLTFFNNQFSWNTTTAQTNSSNQSSATTTGICLVRDSYTSVPIFSAPNLGSGYAKMAKPGVNTISGLQSACSQADFSNLLQTYCTQNLNPIQEQVMTYDSQGNYQSLSCGAFGCNFKNCLYASNQTNTTPATNQSATNQTATNQTASMPDLIVSDMTFVPSNPITSDNVKVLLTVKNIGTATAGNSVAGVTFRSQYLYTVTAGINSLAPGSSQTADMSTVYGWNGSFNAGTYIFNATADIFNAVSESNENNNALAKSLTVTAVASPNQTCTGASKTVDFENPPMLSFHLTWNPDYGTEDSYNYNLDETARQWLKSQGINITTSPNGFVWGTSVSGPVGKTGVVIGDGSPTFAESDQGISDNEILTINFVNSPVKSVIAGLTVTPSDVSSINNVPATVTLEAYDSSNNLVSTATKTFTGVTNGAYTPTTMTISSSSYNIARVTIRTTQYPAGGIWLEDLNFVSCN